MIAILQLDAASVTQLEQLVSEGFLPNFAGLRERGIWYSLETPAAYFEGAAAYSLYTGTNLGMHGIYYPWLWCATEQKVRFFDDVTAPEAVWERIGRAGLSSLIIDPYEMRPPHAMRGIFLSGAQFKNRVVLQRKFIPAAMRRWLEHELGRAPAGEEVYGRPAPSELLRLRNALVAAPARGAALVEKILKLENFDLIWVSLSSMHLGGHRFFDIDRFSAEIPLKHHPELTTALKDIYQSVDEALARVITALPAESDILLVSPTGMGPNTSRSHLLPGMLNAVLCNNSPSVKRRSPVSGNSMWRLRSIVPTNIRSWIARALPDRWAVEIAASLELRDLDWSTTKAFMMPNDDAGYVRLNVRGRERDGIVEPEEVDQLLDRIVGGLMTFNNPDGARAIQKTLRVSDLGFHGPHINDLPDLVILWSDCIVSPLAGVSSPVFGEISPRCWGTGRTGCHTGDAWALIIPSASKLKSPVRRPHILDIAPTVCAALGVHADGLAGQALLEHRVSDA